MIHSYTLLLDQYTQVAIYSKIKKLFKGEISLLFESLINKDVGNYSYIAIGQDEALVHDGLSCFYIDDAGKSKEVDSNPFLFMKEYYSKIDQQFYKEFSQQSGINFTGGFIGFLGYDLVKEFEPKLKERMQKLKKDTTTPIMHLIRPKLILAYSHRDSKLTLITHRDDIKARFGEIEHVIKTCDPYPELVKAKLEGAGSFRIKQERFYEMIERSKEMIRSGDVFQILISNRYEQKGVIDPLSFYRTIRTKNPSPYLFLLDFFDYAIAGSSPEVMVQLQDGEILLRPIAGTRKRGRNLKRDKELEEELKADKKEQSEHIMLVDLGRNDVGRVAKKGTVKVSDLMRVERFSHVMHMVTDVNAQLAEGKDMFDLFAATFTAGTMTGAPKIRAMELIAEFEGLSRNFYSGSVGYFAFNGNMDSGITIRTALIEPERAIFQAGAGVVADSKPELEYLEVENKLKVLISSLEELAKG